MSEKPVFDISHKLSIVQPTSDRAYPIARTEWDSIRDRLDKMSGEPILYQTAGSLTMGAALGIFANLLTGAYSGEGEQVSFAIAATAAVALTLLGCVFFVFAGEQRKHHRTRISEIVAEMKRIEKRYPIDDVPKPARSDVLTLTSFTDGLQNLQRALKAAQSKGLNPPPP